MQLFPDAVIINISPSQKKLLCDPAHAEYVQGIDLIPISRGGLHAQAASVLTADSRAILAAHRARAFG